MQWCYVESKVAVPLVSAIARSQSHYITGLDKQNF